MKFDKQAIMEYLAYTGAAAWGLYAFANLDLVAKVASVVPVPMIDKVLYGAIGLSGGYGLLKKLGWM